MTLKKLNNINSSKKLPFVNLMRYFQYKNLICIVFPLYYMNLYELIVRTNMKGVSLRMVRSITIQLLEGLDKLREMGIIHCDIKPENIMLVNDTNCHVKIIDFGSSVSVYNKCAYTYIQSRFYRAPEIILQLNYKCSIDMWSLATLVFELHCGYPLFDGENEVLKLLFLIKFSMNK